MEKGVLKYGVLLLFLLCRLAGWAAQDYTFRNVVMSDGLSGLLVNAIYKDFQGFVWLGTDNGLDRFDGVQVKHLGFREVEDAKKKRVEAIAETGDHQLWVGNGTGLWKLNKEKDELEAIVPRKIDCAVNALLADGQTLYIGTDRGLFIWRDGQLKYVPVDKNTVAACNRIMDLCLDERKERLWMATVQGLYAYSFASGDVAGWHFREAVSEPDYFRCVTRVGHTLYLGTMSQGVLRFDTRSSKFMSTVDLGCKVISDISSDGKETVYVATDGNGVHFLSHREQRVVRSFRHDVHGKDGIRSNSIYSLLVDERGSVWVGHFQAGLDYSLYQNEWFHTYAYPPLFDSANISVRSFLIRGAEKLIGSRDGLFYINEATGVVKSFLKPELTSDLILSMCFYQGYFYIGTYGGGLLVLDPATLSLRKASRGGKEWLPNGHVFCLVPDSVGNLWTGTSQGLYCYNKSSGALQSYTSSNSQLPEGNVYEVRFDSSGKGWVATEKGMCIYDPASGSLRSNVFPDGFVNRDKVRCIYEDTGNNLYFLREKGSLFTSTLSMDRFRDVSIMPTVPENAWLSIVEDGLGWLWVTCNDGLIRFKEDGVYDAFTFNDGLPSPTFTSCTAFRDEQGILWFGNVRGLIYADPAEVDRMLRQAVRSIVFTDVLVNGVSVRSRDLQHEQNNLTFCFTDFAYGLPAAMMYEYRLDGVDSKWKLLTSQNEVSYFGLPPGKYAFRVRLPGNERSESVLAFTIAPWAPAWLWGGAVVWLAAVAWFVRYRFRKTRSSSVVAMESGATPDIPAVSAVQAESLAGEPEKEEEETVAVKANRLGDAECKALHEKLLEFMEKERPYVHPDLKMKDLAVAVGTTSHTMSYLLNQYLSQSYYDFINEYRVAEFKRLVADERYRHYSLVGLAEMCGFNSRASFFRSFKKIQGVTPNEYIRNLSNQK